MISRFAVIFLCASLLSSCETQQQPINMVGNSWLGYQPFYAQHQLHPERHPNNIHITMLVSDISVIRMLTNEAASVAMLSLDNAISLNSRTNLDFCIASVLSSSNGADAILMHPEFATKLDSDEPIRVGMEDSALARYLLSRWVESAGIAEQRIEREVILPNYHASSFANDQFDVVVAYAPFTTRLESAGAIPIFSSADIPDEVIDVVVVRRALWAREHERLKPLLTASWDQAFTAAQQPDSDIFKAMMIFSELTSAELSATMADLKFYDASKSAEFLAGGYAQVQQTVSEYLIKAGVHQQVKPLPVCEGVL